MVTDPLGPPPCRLHGRGLQGRGARVDLVGVRARAALRPETRAWHQNGRWYPHAQGRPEVLLIGVCAGQISCSDDSAPTSKIFTLFEGTSEIQRMIIGRAITGLDVR
jgi:hypothetical protein